MSGDYSRKRFNPANHYQGVLRQQGRVDLDADWNEYIDLQDRRWRAETIDVVGRCGVPMETPNGFKVAVAAGELTIGQGRIYVDGYLAENQGTVTQFNPTLEERYGSAALAVKDQPYGGPVAVPPQVRSLVYLDVWRREVTHLQAPDLIEPAVNVDTTTRYQTAWQVKLLGNLAAGVTCRTPLTEIANWPAGNLPSAARLTTTTVAVSTEPDPCLVPPSGGYRGLENHLYRVEVHSVTTTGAMRVKWSRENAHVATNVLEILAAGKTIRVESLGRDDVLRFKTGDWVEITSDRREFNGLPGEMRKVTVEDTNQTLSFDIALPQTDFPIQPADPEDHLRVIRWDQSGSVRKPDGSELINLDLTADGLILLTAANPSFILEYGVQVTFSIDGTGAAHSGDTWCFAARTADADIERLDQAPPLSIHHHFCKLAIIEANGAIQDCRPQFPALTELVSLFYVGGDGQESLPGQPLPKPIQVGVANGKRPVVGATVRFRVTGGNGSLTAGTTSGVDINLVTDAQGVASCVWTLDGVNQSQQVEAMLADGSHLPVRFNASLSQAGGLEPGVHVRQIFVAEKPLGNDTNVTVPELLRGLRIECDADLLQGSVGDKPVCFVTLEMPFPFNSADMQLWGSTILGFQPLILGADVKSEGPMIFWQAARPAGVWLETRLFQMMTELKRGERVLARLTLKGNFIWSAKDSNHFVDGEVFGNQTPGRAVTDVKFPSGDGRRGGDLEMWFWLVPPPPPPTITATFPTATATIVTQPTLTLTFPTATIVTQPTLTLPTATATIITRPTFTATVVNPTLVRPTVFGAGQGPGEAPGSATIIVPPRERQSARENPFAEIRQISAAQAKKLIAAGIGDLLALSNAAPQAVMSALGIRNQVARAMIAEARRLSGKA